VIHRFGRPAATVPLLLLLARPVLAPAQEVATDPNPYPRSFEAVDVSMGAVFIQNAEPGIGFTVGADVSNLLLKRFVTRFDFRLWASENVLGPLRVVALNDFAFGVMQRLRIGGRGFALSGGMGVSLHIISARIQGTDLTGSRNGLKPGLDLQLGMEVPVAEDGFVTVFAYGLGSLVPTISQAMFQVGVRLRFDKLVEG
jgi:hypothetical protein